MFNRSHFGQPRLTACRVIADFVKLFPFDILFQTVPLSVLLGFRIRSRAGLVPKDRWIRTSPNIGGRARAEARTERETAAQKQREKARKSTVQGPKSTTETPKKTVTQWATENRGHCRCVCVCVCLFVCDFAG